MVDLSSIKFDTSYIPTRCLEDLISLISTDNSEEKLILIVQKSLSARLNLLTPFSVLQKRGNISDIFWMENELSQQSMNNALFKFYNENDKKKKLYNSKTIVILCGDDIHNTEYIHSIVTFINDLCEKYNAGESDMNTMNLNNFAADFKGVIFSDDGKLSDSFKFRLEKLGVSHLIKLFNWNLKPSLLDEDLLSLELKDEKIIHELYLRNTNECIYKLCYQFHNLFITNNDPENLINNRLVKFNNVLIKGNKANRFYNLLKIIHSEYLSLLTPIERQKVETFEKVNYGNSNIGKSSYHQYVDLIVLERSVDFLTPFLSQLTYLGLIDDLYDFKGNLVNLSKENIFMDKNIEDENDSGASPRKIDQVLFNFKDDEILNNIKDLNFGAVGPVLTNFAKILQSEFDSRHNLNKISEVKEFVGKLGGLQKFRQSLKDHTLLSENILLKVKGGSSPNATLTPQGHSNKKNSVTNEMIDSIFDDDDAVSNDDDDTFFSRLLDLQRGILDSSYDIKKSTDLIIHMIHIGNFVEVQCLKICCLLSKVHQGIPSKHYNALKTEIIETFGIKHIITLQRLQKLKLFYIREPSSFLNIGGNISSTGVISNGSGGNSNDSGNEILNGTNEVDDDYEDDDDFLFFDSAANHGDDNINRTPEEIIKNFTSIKNYLNLVPDGVYDNIKDLRSKHLGEDPSNPIDATFAFPNFVPINARLIQSAYDRSFFNSSASSYLTKAQSRYLNRYASWKGMDDLWGLLGNKTKETTFLNNGKPAVNRIEPSDTGLVNSMKNNTGREDDESLCFIVMIGGLTYGEVACIRFIEKKLREKGINKRFIILTDCMINGDRIIEQLIPNNVGSG